MPYVLRAVAVSCLLTLTVGACTPSEPEQPPGPSVPAESAFAEGTCRVAAPDVRAIGAAVPRLGKEGKVDQQVQDELRDAQQRLAALAEGAEPELKPALDDLVLKIGLLRIRAAGNTYESSLGEGLTTSYDAVLDVCTTG